MEEDVDVALGHAGIVVVETIAHSEVYPPQEMKGSFADMEHSMQGIHRRRVSAMTTCYPTRYLNEIWTMKWRNY